MAQTSYSYDMPRARAGMDAYPGRHDRKIQTYAAEGAVKFGYAVVQGTTKDQAKIPTAASDKLVGFAQMTLAINETSSSGSTQYDNKDAMNVMKYGEIWVPYSGTLPTAGATLYVDVLVAPGKVTTVSTNNMAAALKCLDADSALGLALVEIQQAL